MEWTKDDMQHLLEFRKRIDDDNIRCKEIIKKKLINNPYIIHVLNNKDLEESDAEPDDYYGKNILPAYIIPETQSSSLNFICFTVGFRDSPQWARSTQKYLQITFVVLVHKLQLIDKETSLARHDLLSALIKDEFNLSLAFGDRIQICSDQESVVDSDYSARTLIFETMTDKDLVKTKSGIPTIVNHSLSEI